MTDEYYMRLALLEAKKAARRNEIPVGAIIVNNGKIIARTYNSVKKHKNCLKHAELKAISLACKKIKYERLNKCSMYVTLEPCYMCAGAIFQARIEKLVYGTSNILNNIENMNSNMNLNHRMQVKKGILEDECKELLNVFFKKIRKN